MADSITYHLVVTSPFDGYSRGDKITDQDEIERILASENAEYVNRVLS